MSLVLVAGTRLGPYQIVEKLGEGPSTHEGVVP